MKFVGDLVGLLTLLALVAVCAVLVPSSEVTPLVWLFAYFGLAFICLTIWHGKSAPAKPKAWLGVLGVIALLTGLFFCVDVMTGLVFHPQARRTLLEAAESAGGPLGFWFTVLIMPAAFCAAFAGLVRCLFLTWLDKLHA